MTVFLFLCLSSLLLLSTTDAESRHRRQQPVNISSPDVTEAESTDYEDHNEASDSDSVPLIPLDVQPPGMNSNPDNASTCPHDFCKLWQPCGDGEICVTSPAPGCKSECLKNGSQDTDYTATIATVGPEDTTTLRPISNRTCARFPGLDCSHGIADCNDAESGSDPSFSCRCDSGWTGNFCQEECTLPCVHGACDVSVDGEMFCSCQHKYMGHLCAELVPDTAERARILAAILSTAVAVAIILIIIIPIIMWRLRVILILKLIYIFKEYEDEDGKENDAYISMTSTPSAENFVYGSLRPILEEHNFKLFLHARDAPANEVMSEIILSEMEKSRRTIMIITPDYIKNEWNRFEYLIAQHETLKLQQRIIPIILEDVEKETVNMDKSLKHILDSIKCLKYPKAKPKSDVSHAEGSLQNIQSPGSNRSVNSTTHFFRRERSYSTDSVPKEDTQFERKVAKFWKRLVLTMPKKKTQKDQTSLSLSKSTKTAKNEISTIKFEDTLRSLESNLQKSYEFDFKINVISDKSNDVNLTKSGNLCNAKSISEEIKIQNDQLTSSIA